MGSEMCIRDRSIDGCDLTSGFLYAYCHRESKEEKNWAAFYRDLEILDSDKKAVFVSFSDDHLPLDAKNKFAACYRVTTIDVFEKIMHAHMDQNETVFVLSPVIAIAQEGAGYRNTLSDVLYALKGMLNTKRADGVKPTAIVISTPVVEGANHSRHTLAGIAEKTFNRTATI